MILRFAATLAAIVVLAGLAWWLGLGRDRLIGSADAAMAAAEQALSGFEATGALIGSDGGAAIVAGKAGRLALLKRHGAHVAAREVTASALHQTDGGTLVETGERRFGRVLLTGVDRVAIDRLADN